MMNGYQQDYIMPKHHEYLYDYHYVEAEDWKDFKLMVDKMMNHEMFHNEATYRVTLEDYQRVFNPLTGKFMHVGTVRIYRNKLRKRREAGK